MKVTGYYMRVPRTSREIEMGYHHFMLGWSIADTSHFVFDQLYFHNPFWITAYNFLHSPVLLILGLTLCWRGRRNIGSRSHWCFWFLVACLFHSVVDIFTHVDDGPLLLFPLEWSIRFHSPASYWNSQHYGREFQWFERVLDIALLIYLLRARLGKRRSLH